MMDAISAGSFTNIDYILIARNNTLVFDELIRDSLDSRDAYIGNNNIRVHSMQSTTKSIVSALVGIAIDQGYIQDVNQPFYDFFTEYNEFDNWDDRKFDVTLANVLTMRHGLDWDEWSIPFNNPGNSLSDIYRRSNDYVKSFLDLPVATTPGTTFAYSTIASIALGGAVENATGVPLEEFAETFLFGPLDITSYIWDFTPVGRAHTGGGLWMGGRGMVKFGQLFLDRGQWQGQQIISEAWVDASTRRAVEFDFGYSDGYGYQWWREDISVSGETLELFFTAGNGGQFIYIVPERDAVIVFQGSNYDSEAMYQPDVILREYVLPALE